MKSELLWGRNQCLYRAAPYSVIYNPNTRLHEMILPWRSSADPETNAELVKTALRRELRRYRVPPVPPERVKNLSLSIQRLEAIETTIYPTAFHCSHCGFLVAEDPGKSSEETSRAGERLANRISGDLGCPREGCGGRLVQWNFLTVHECGDTIHLPTFFFARCRDHGDKNLHFDRHGSERASDWEVVCRVPGCGFRRRRELFFYAHKDCPLTELAEDQPEGRSRFLNYSTGPIAKATNFIPRVLRVLNSSVQERSPPPGSRAALAVALGALRTTRYGFDYHGGLSHWMDTLVVPDRPSPARRSRLEELVGKMPDEKLKQQILEELKQENEKADDLSGDSGLQSLTEDPSYIREAAAIATYNHGESSNSISEILTDPTLAEESKESLSRAAELSQELHIRGLRHVEDINLTSCLVGYSRADYDPARVQLRLYLERRGGAGQYRVYTNTVQTEGLYFQLDPTEVLRWLGDKSGEEAEVKDSFSHDLLTLQMSFEEGHIPVFKPPLHPWCGYYFSLLHTVSHLLIKQLGTYSGLEQEGLSEEIYPYQCAGLIYVNQGAEFSLEGLRLAFEHHLQQIMDGIRRDSRTCLYDPECQVSQGACHGCIHLAEISCTHFNRLLDRRLLSPTSSDGLWS